MTLATLPGAAWATVTVFNVSGTLNLQSTFAGTVTIDTAPGVLNPVTAIDITGTAGLKQFNGFHVTTVLSAEKLNGYNYFIIEGSGSGYGRLKLVLPTASLVGYTGGGLCPEFQTAPLFCGFSTTALAANGTPSALASGGIVLQAGTPAVPEPATGRRCSRASG